MINPVDPWDITIREGGGGERTEGGGKKRQERQIRGEGWIEGGRDGENKGRREGETSKTD